MTYSIIGFYQSLGYKITSDENGTAYEVFDFGAVTDNPIPIMGESSANPNEYMEEIIKEKIDDYKEFLKNVK